MQERPVFALLTDFGVADGYVAAVKSVILDLTRDASFVDISHQVPAQNVAIGAALLNEVEPYLPRGAVCLAVVDPGVGTSRRALAIRSSHRGLRFVGPDNGLLWQAAGRHADAVRAIENPDFLLPQVSKTFHGRDVFAPVAAHLALGARIEEVGPEVCDMVQLAPQAVLKHAAGLAGCVSRIDIFGNIISNIHTRDLPAAVPADALVIDIGGQRITGLSPSYGHVAPGDLLALIGSSQMLEISVRDGSAAQRLGVTPHMSFAVDVSW